MLAENNKKYTVNEFYAIDNLSERAELIDGIIHDPAVLEDGTILDMAPGANTIHQDIAVGLIIDIGNYIRKHKGKCKLYTAPYDVKLDESNTVQPDIFVVCDPSKIGNTRCDGAPDWIIEIVSPSSISRDMSTKASLYSKTGVREYWIVNPIDEKAIVYKFDESRNVGFYTFNDKISVGIYKEASEPLSIRINDLL